jgi:hypothetical protein
VSAYVCQPVLRPFVGDVLNLLNAAQMEAWQERCAVVEFDAGLARPLAEALALIELLRHQPDILADALVLEIELDGGTEWLVTSNLDSARHYAAGIGGFEVGTHRLTDVLRDQYGGIAVLGTLG